jgi:DNA-binding transcriptional regulator LsrR (DeoR family)
MQDWWYGLEHEILDCLRARHDVTPAELARKLRISEAGVNSLLAMMAAEGKIQIQTVGAVPSAWARAD